MNKKISFTILKLLIFRLTFVKSFFPRLGACYPPYKLFTFFPFTLYNLAFN